MSSVLLMPDPVFLYPLLKYVHIVTSALLFGTSFGTAFHLWSAWRSGNAAALHSAAGAAVRATWLFTATSIVVQPVSGAALLWVTGHDPMAHWLVATYAIYVLMVACWLRVVGIQIQVRNLSRDIAGEIPEAVDALMRRWFTLGWPAFAGILVIFWMMVSRPT
jgi:uncharacterized membrane protein